MSIEHQIEELLDRWEELQEQRGLSVPAEEMCEDPLLLAELRRIIHELQWVDALLDESLPLGPLVSDKPETIGRYRIHDLLGEGGQGRVWRGYDPELDRDVAVKVLHADRAQSSLRVTQFVEEGRKVAKLHHPNITTVHDVGRDGESCYIVCELVEGETLAQAGRDRRLSFDQAAGIVAEVAEALHHAHENGIIHRDVKPGNILLTPDLEPLITDFGIAAAAGARDDAGIHPGTPRYMSPEQASDQATGVDPRSDVYSLGVVLYELLTGEPPFEVHSLCELRQKMASGPPPPPRSLKPDIPKKLQAICMKALEPKPERRWASAHEFSRALSGWSDGRTRRFRSYCWKTITLVVAVAAVVLLVAWLSRFF